MQMGCAQCGGGQPGGQSVLLVLLPAPVLLLLLLDVLLLGLRGARSAWGAEAAGEALASPAVLLSDHLKLLS